jgi:hypothetical protein
MKIIIDVTEGQEDFLMKLLKSLNIVNSIEEIEKDTYVVSHEHVKILQERMESYNAGNIQTKSWEQLQKDLLTKYGL